MRTTHGRFADRPGSHYVGVGVSGDSRRDHGVAILSARGAIIANATSRI
jgi:hypothetical protein